MLHIQSTTKSLKGGRKAAIKRFSMGKDPNAWHRESSALKIAGRVNLPHVVPVEAMFRQDSNFYLMLPWADGKNLMDFWERHDSYDCRCSIARQFICQILDQLEGISKALEFFHDFKGNKKASYRHGDLKPENILVFWANESPEDVPGTWKMADFGLAKMHETVTGKRHDCTTTSIRGWGTISYRPPETFENQKIATSRRFDIWSMGCIILQLITWLVHGMHGVKELTRRTKRKFGDHSFFWSGDYSNEGGWYNVTVHNEVTKLIHELRQDLQESPALLDLLAVVETKLLVIKCPVFRTRGKQDVRTDAHGLRECLRRIRQQCQQSPSRWSNSVQVVRQSRSTPPVEGVTRYAQAGMDPHQEKNVSS